MSGDDEYAFYVEPDDLDLSGSDVDQLVALARGSVDPYNARALVELGLRASEQALPLAQASLSSLDDHLAGTAYEVLARLDFPAALTAMREAVADCSPRVMLAISDIVAVQHPVDPHEERTFLSALARRLAQPESSVEFDAADLFFRQYPAFRR